jgi:phosphohistidine phosphatase
MFFIIIPFKINFMKRIIFMRHGKAEDPLDGISDLERSLTLKGKVVTRQMAQILKEKIKNPGMLITSPAFRAYETAFIFAGEYGISAEKIKICNNIYFKLDEKTIMDILKQVDETTDTVTLFGHNPSFTTLPEYFSKQSTDVVPKSGIVCLRFSVSTWSEIKPSTADAELILKPKKLL